MNTMQRTVGDVLREWRQRRHLSQTGRSNPSRDLLVHLADHLRVPLRERNALLLAGGFAPVYPQRTLDDPSLAAARQAIDLILKGHEPYPALAVDRHWNLVAANRALPVLLDGVAPKLLQPPVNVLHLSMHPDGLAARIANRSEWRTHVIGRLEYEIDISADLVLVDLLREIRSYPAPPGGGPARTPMANMVVPFQLQTEAGMLSFFSTTTVFGTATEVTLSELAIESFFPADRATADTMQHLMANAGTQGTRELTTDE